MRLLHIGKCDRTKILVCLLLICVAIAMMGCGNEEKSTKTPVANPTEDPTAASPSVATPTATPQGITKGPNYTIEILDEEKKEAAIVKISNITKVLDVPEKVGDYTITQIGTEFSDGSFETDLFTSIEERDVILEELILPQTLKVIGEHAFACMNLRKVILLGQHTHIRKAAFFGLPLEELYIPKGFDGIIDESVFNVSSLKQFEWPSEKTTKNVSSGAFFGNRDLERIIFPDGLKEAIIADATIGNFFDTVKDCILPESVDIFNYGNENIHIKNLIIKGKKTAITSTKGIGEKGFNYLDAETIIAPKGSKAIEFAKNAYYPYEPNKEGMPEFSDGCEFPDRTESNYVMKKIKYIEITVPKAPTLVQTKSTEYKRTVSWKAVPGAELYRVYISENKDSGFEEYYEITDTSTKIGRQDRHGNDKDHYVKVKSVMTKYGTTWTSGYSNSN